MEVREIRVPVTAWPTTSDPGSCDLLTKEDFVVEVGGHPVEITDFVRRGGEQLTFPEPSGATPGSGQPRQGLTLVLLIDEFHHSCPACCLRVKYFGSIRDCVTSLSQPFMRAKLYDRIRRMLKASFRPEDRLLIASLSFFPRAESGWITSLDEALSVLDRMQARTDLWVPQHLAQPHVRHWYDGMRDFVRALGAIPGPKDVLFPTCHFPLDATDAEQIRDLGAVAAASDVVVHTIDIVQDGTSPELDIGPLAVNLGGRRFGASFGYGRAIDELRRVLRCRFVLFFRDPDPASRRKVHDLRVRLRRSGFSLSAPSVYPGRVLRPTGDETRVALLRLGEFSRGLSVRGSVVPVQMVDERTWKVRALVTVEAGDAVAPDELPRGLGVDLVNFSTRLEEPIVARIPLPSDLVERLLVQRRDVTLTTHFEVTAGSSDWSLILSDGEGRPRYAAVRRYELDWPDRRKLRRFGFWLPARQVRAQHERDLLLPQLDGRFRSGRTVFVLGLWCGADDSRPRPAVVLRSAEHPGAPPIPVRVVTTRTTDAICPRCGHCEQLFGRPHTAPGPGTWILSFGEDTAGSAPAELARIVVGEQPVPPTARTSRRSP
ncbi:MAG: hypothetical protein D6738_00780 [Acidobacteria bacterium]|nr:MAG: hypothetical protein D6738_00780 [Acidobacteriota bacterium]